MWSRSSAKSPLLLYGGRELKRRGAGAGFNADVHSADGLRFSPGRPSWNWRHRLPKCLRPAEPTPVWREKVHSRVLPADLDLFLLGALTSSKLPCLRWRAAAQKAEVPASDHAGHGSSCHAGSNNLWFEVGRSDENETGYDTGSEIAEYQFPKRHGLGVSVKFGPVGRDCCEAGSPRFFSGNLLRCCGLVAEPSGRGPIRGRGPSPAAAKGVQQTQAGTDGRRTVVAERGSEKLMEHCF